MVTFFATHWHQYPINRYLDAWAPELRKHVRVRGYEDLPQEGSLEPGTYIFTDQERWTQRQFRLAVELWEQLVPFAPSIALLNDPRRVLLRYDLLKKLHQIGHNDFDVHKISESLSLTRWPVFLHSLGGHEGPMSPLLHNRAALLFWVAYAFLRRPGRKLMVEEFCDVYSSGLYAKYGAFNFGGQIVPRHLFFGKRWSLKDTEYMSDDVAVRYENYLRQNPDAAQLENVFTVAGIDYGRVDYAFRNGRLQVWEINTNPMIIGKLTEKDPPAEAELCRKFHAMIKPHFLRLSALSQGERSAPYRLTGRF